MGTENTEALRRNLIRKRILQCLAPGYPNAQDAIILRRSLADLGYPMTEESLLSYCAYLAERQLARIDVREQFGICLITITANGLDVLDGRSTDPGVGA